MYTIDPERQRIQDIEDLPKYRKKFHSKVDVTPEDEQRYSSIIQNFFSSEEEWSSERLNQVLQTIRKEKKLIISHHKLRVI